MPPPRALRQRGARPARLRATALFLLAATAFVAALQHFRPRPRADTGEVETPGLPGTRRLLGEDAWPETDLPECRQNPMLPECSPAAFSVMADGDLESRLHAVCSAFAVRAGSKARARAIWVVDNAAMPYTKFADLFQPADWVQDSAATAQEWKARMGPFYRTLSVPACQKGAKWGLPAGISFGAFLSAANINFAEFEQPCAVLRSYKACFAALQPSAEVEALVRNEPHLDRLAKTVAVFVDQVSPGGACGGCTGNESTPDVCMVRRLTRQYLRDSSRDFTVGALAAADAPTVANYFDPSRAPLILQVTRRRATKCPLTPPLVAIDGSSSSSAAGSALALSWRRRLLLEEDEGAKLAEQLAASAKKGGGLGHPSPKGFFEIDEAQKKQVAFQAAAADGGRTAEGSTIRMVANLRVPPRDLAECIRLQVAELFALAQAEGFIPMNESAISSLLVASKGAARTDSFRAQQSVCQAPAIPPITKQKFSMFVIIEEKLKLVYCAIPKVACTSWLMWLRAQLGYRDPKNPWLALHEYDSGLKNLGIHFTERQATRLITRPDFFKFTFVRNPFSRAASAYANKLVKSDTPGKKTGPGSRAYWNWAFFRSVQPLFDAVKDEEQLVSFHDFTKLVEAVLERSRWSMDRHIAPQVDICNLDHVKYDFVGKFEDLQADVRKVVARYGGQHMDIFNFGRKAHYTNATGKLAKIYDQDSYNAVKRIYAEDFYVALNNITQGTPEDLQHLFE